MSRWQRRTVVLPRLGDCGRVGVRHQLREEATRAAGGAVDILGGLCGRAVGHAARVTEGAATAALNEVALVLALALDELTAARARAKARVARVLQRESLWVGTERLAGISGSCSLQAVRTTSCSRSTLRGSAAVDLPFHPHPATP